MNIILFENWIDSSQVSQLFFMLFYSVEVRNKHFIINLKINNVYFIIFSSDFDDSDDLQRRKKARTAFSTDQIHDLEKRYQAQKYLPANERQTLAEKLGLSDQQVLTIFS